MQVEKEKEVLEELEEGEVGDFEVVEAQVVVEARV